MKHVFIVGSPRSGSTWATFMLSQHPRIATFQHAQIFAYLVEMMSWHTNKAEANFIVNPGAESNGEPEEHNYLKLSDVVTKDVLHSLLGDVAAGIMNRVAGLREGASVVVDKTPENGRLAPFILDVLPDAHFLHIVRDPRSVFCSLRSASSTWARWHFPTHPIDGARYWREDLEPSLAIRDLTPNYHEVRYEDLRANGEAGLKGILDWLGVDADEAFCREAVANSSKEKMRPNRALPADFVRKTRSGGWRDELSPRDARLMEYMLGDLMQTLGYEPSQPPFSSKPLRLTLHDIPTKLLSLLDTKLHRLTQLAHWRWVGRRLDWPHP